MSSTNRGAKRRPLDAYYTQDAVARGCVSTIAPEIAGERVLEPHAGGGAFVRALLEFTPHLLVNDVNENAPALLVELGEEGWCRDFLTGPIPEDVDWVVGNPPFNDAEAHIRRALEVAQRGVAFLLRLAFLESGERRGLWDDHPPAEVHVLRSRPSFKELYEDGTVGRLRKRDKDTGEIVFKKNGKPQLAGVDSAAYGWFVWRRGRDPKEPTTLHHLDWKEGSP